MSRKEEIKAKAVEIQEDHYDGYYSGYIESYQKTAIDAATWADKTMIAKACEWLKDNAIRYVYENYFGEIRIEEKLIEDFKTSMEK